MPGSAGSFPPVPEMDRADQELAAQYEAYPYPARDPREESRRLIIGRTSMPSCSV